MNLNRYHMFSVPRVKWELILCQETDCFYCVVLVVWCHFLWGIGHKPWTLRFLKSGRGPWNKYKVVKPFVELTECCCQNHCCSSSPEAQTYVFFPVAAGHVRASDVMPRERGTASRWLLWLWAAQCQKWSSQRSDRLSQSWKTLS